MLHNFVAEIGICAALILVTLLQKNLAHQHDARAKVLWDRLKKGKRDWNDLMLLPSAVVGMMR